MPPATAMKFDSTQHLLEQWAVWVRQSSELRKVYFPSSAPYYLPLSASTNMLSISEDEALIADGLVARLKMRDKEMGSVVINYYLGGGSLRYASEVVGISLKKTRILAEAGTSWIDAKING